MTWVLVIKHPIDVFRVQQWVLALLWPQSVQEVAGSVILVKGAGSGSYWWKGDFMASQSVVENIQRAHKLFHFGGLGAFQGN